MAHVIRQELADRYAVYNGDCMDVMAAMPSESVGLTVYSPPFAGLYHYSSDPRDHSNVRSYGEFMDQYRFVVAELARITMPGRVSAVHCVDLPTGNTGKDALRDFPGDIIRLHAEFGFEYTGRYCVWKEPLGVRNRTMVKSLSHQTTVDDSSRCSVASADYLVTFRRRGTNPEPIAHPNGFLEYAGSRPTPADVLRFRGWTGPQIENRYSHWIWRQYASAFWDDIRLDRVLPFLEAREDTDEKHVHPLQLDVIDRVLALWSNSGDRVFTPYMGVGSEVFSAVRAGRMGMGVELKRSYYDQALRNLHVASSVRVEEQPGLFEMDEMLTASGGQ